MYQPCCMPLAAYEEACPGVPLPAQQAGNAAPTLDRLASQLFADDFMGIAETPEALQQGVAAARRWCDKWRMQANIGPAKTAVMVFAPDHALPLLDGAVQWGSEPLPVVTQYKYLGVMLSADCLWDAHVDYLCDKARKTA